jgi:hypothetical protein
MRPVLWAAGASVCFCLAATALVQPGPDLFLGMLAPAVVSVITSLMVERTYRRNPTQVTPLMMAAFVGKMVIFGAYVAIALKVLSVRPVPFVISFTSCFIALHLTEALCLRRLFAEGMRDDPERTAPDAQLIRQ